MHTKGVWLLDLYPNGGFQIEAPGAGFHGGTRVIASRQAHSGAIEEMHANARLMAAAPDLLIALQALFDNYKALADSGDAGNWSLEEKPVGYQALVAIAKATGQPIPHPPFAGEG